MATDIVDVNLKNFNHEVSRKKDDFRIENSVLLRGFFFLNVTLLFAVLLAACPQPQTQPQTWEGEREYNGFRYIITPANIWVIEIIGYTGSETDISIPNRIENLPVVFINGREFIHDEDFLTTGIIEYTEGAFENKSLTSVIIPDTVRGIYSGAFANNNLTEVHLPENLTVLGPCTFMNNQLTSIVIPDHIRQIGMRAFEGNEITGVSIGSDVGSIWSAAFRNNKITNLTIPANVTHIGDFAFASNEIVELNLAEGLTGISSFAFEDNRLTSLSIPAGVKIAPSAFKGNDITRISIGENVQLYPGNEAPVFELGFDEFYLENGEHAGEYVYENGAWEFLGDD